ncbi:Bug family tripartite tricarboxylate transporter substrate binding protein [Cupriavidus sp. D39]|uniref:Bug family tripartite tricarboxylate transporter substrate binding protein n=1 Tax=Cupriavidus sp. D39 TaxID=2997877 RepID=UPI00226ECE4C|nr:tripartite tricarboxylate transporter substrate-binding protein [Cupriavidus sp. D39]MCY0853513.1 tripartite tricarboxylate transporter substrate-binding protein [Cupriavidus sp. D39]
MILKAFSHTIVALIAASTMVGVTQAREFPSQPIKILVGFGAGGGTDTIARLYARALNQELNTPVIVENKPGASQLVAIRTLLASQPDGYTLMLASGSALAQGPGVRRDLPYDPLKDFSLISMVATAPGVFVVNPRLPVRSMDELISYAKAHPGALNYGTAGVGAANHLQMKYLENATGVSMTHIPYKSDQEVTLEVGAGEVQVGLSVPQFVIPLIAAGKLKGIAVTGSSRLHALPNVPSLAEAHIAALSSMQNYTFYGLIGPKGMSPAIVERINAAVNKASASPDVAKRLRETLYCEPVVGSTASFRDYMNKEVGKWRELGRTVIIGATGD